MALKYHLIQRGKPGKPEEPKQYYASLKSGYTVSVRELAEEISSRCTVNSADVMAMMEALLQAIPDHLANGRCVNLGEFGSFFINLSSEATDDPKDFRSDMIKKAMVRFRPAKEFKRRLNGIVFEKK